MYNWSLIQESIPKKYDKIIVSWAKKNDFNESGVYFDKYSKTISSDIKSSLWFLLYTDEELPQKIDDNIIILKKTRRKIKYNFLYLLKNIFKNILASRFSLKKIFHKTSWYSEFANITCDKIKPFITSNVKTIIMPYEGQPFQNSIIKKGKAININIKTVGYVHSFPVGLPTNLISRDGSPDELIVNGKDQFYCFNSYLNWNSKNLKI